MRIVLEWCGSATDLCDDGEYTLADDIMWVIDYANYGDEVKHRGITIRKEKEE